MSQREAFEAHIERKTGERPSMIGGAYNNVGWRKSWEDWQAAIQYARDGAVKACETTRFRGYAPPEDGNARWYYNEASQDCADAVKEALK